jgi:hypothetical protein
MCPSWNAGEVADGPKIGNVIVWAHAWRSTDGGGAEGSADAGDASTTSATSATASTMTRRDMRQ